MDLEDDNLTTFNKTLKYDWSSDEYEKELHNDVYVLQTMAITLYSIAFALGIIGNGLVIWIAGFRMKNTISAVWFLNLAIADFLCCASLPLRIAEWTVAFTYDLDFAYCILNMFLFTVNMSASVLLLTAMSIERWVSVMWPLWAKVHRTSKLVKITAAIIWVLSLILTGLVYNIYRYHVGDVDEWCVTYYYAHPYNPEIYWNIQLIRLVIMFSIPFVIIITTYVTIFYKLRKSKRSQRSQRTSRTITAVILCFFVCWFPYYMWPLISGYYEFSLLVLIVHTIITMLAYLNSCINPIIYTFMVRDFQQGFFRSIPTRLERALGDHPNVLDKQRNNI
ncbi:C3a anaphylatoxin chemotactic receptor-like [Ranitomeya variabilis]|uniref:C3a anaphylatoxin chemotactic receptor-like n=1 Tax=Ranitomeya variabilis TaxID=490064 RepID=UPI004056FEB1